MHPVQGAARLGRDDGVDSRRRQGARNSDRRSERRLQARDRALARGRRQARARRALPVQEKQDRLLRGQRDGEQSAHGRARTGRGEKSARGGGDRSRAHPDRDRLGRAAFSRHDARRWLAHQPRSAGLRPAAGKRDSDRRRRSRARVRLFLPRLRRRRDDRRAGETDAAGLRRGDRRRAAPRIHQARYDRDARSRVQVDRAPRRPLGGHDRTARSRAARPKRSRPRSCWSPSGAGR